MTKQTDAMRLADKLEDVALNAYVIEPAVAELRSQHNKIELLTVDLERLRDENERLHVENRRLIDRIEVMGVPVGVGGYLTTTTTPPAQPAPAQEPAAWAEEINDWFLSLSEAKQAALL